MNIKLLLLSIALLFCLHSANAQGCPPNIDFEAGNFNGWECFIGTTRVESGANLMDLVPSAPLPGRHEIITTASRGIKDPFGNFPILCPYGGTTSVKLGNSSVGYEAEALSYTFVVPNVVDTFSFTYYYAVVFQDPAHSAVEQPRFFVSAYDVETGDLINCASYDYIATGGIPGFKQSKTQIDVLYKEWSPVTIQFAGLANRKVRLEFKTADCTQGGHFGYAYVDVGSGCSNVLATAPYCIESNSIILNAPYGFKSYTWYNEDYSEIIGHDQSITLSPPPAAANSFHVDIVPYPGYGCRDTASAYVVPRPVPKPPEPDPLIVYCQNQVTGDFTLTPTPGNDLIWYTSETGGTGDFSPPVISTEHAGEKPFWVSEKELFGCESPRVPFVVRIQRSPEVSFDANSTMQCLKGNEFEFTSTSANLEKSSFIWDFGDGQLDSLAGEIVAYKFSQAGRYNVRLTVMNDRNCPHEANAIITVGAHAVAGFRAPAVICEDQVSVQLLDNSLVPGAASTLTGWWWQIDGTTYYGQTPAAFRVQGHDSIRVRMAVNNTFNCASDTITRSLPVRLKPGAAFALSALLCNNEPVYLTDQSTMPAASPDRITKWYWQADQGSVLGNTNPVMHLLSGLHQIKLTVESNYGCKSDVAEKSVFIHPKPQIHLSINDSCVRRLITFESKSQLQNVNTWLWNFGNGQYESGPLHTRTYSSQTTFPLQVIGKTNEGCKDTVQRAFRIFENFARAGRDTIVAKHEPVQLNARGGTGVTYSWSPGIGLNNAGIENPVATLDSDQLYKLYAISEQGCETFSQIFIKRYHGPELYIPNAFTPDNDGTNDQLKVFPVGIRKFHYLAVYNRNGQLMFRTTDYAVGWNGYFSSKKMESGTYIAVALAEDYRGQRMMKKTSVLLLR